MWTKPLPGSPDSSFKVLRSMRNRPRIIARRFRKPTTALLKAFNAAIPRRKLLSNCSALQAHAEGRGTLDCDFMIERGSAGTKASVTLGQFWAPLSGCGRHKPGRLAGGR